MYRLLIVLCCLFSIACSRDNPLKRGTFLLYEKGEIVDTIYRMDNYQIESAKGKALVAKLNWISNDSLIMSGVETNPTGVDRIIFSVWYEKQAKTKYNLYSQALNSDQDYYYEAILEKVSDSIENKKYLRRLQELNGF